MGQHAEDLINGDVDQYTGEWLGNGGGFPRSMMVGYQPKKYNRKPTSTGAKVRGVEKWLSNKKIELTNEQIGEFLAKHQPHLNLKNYNLRRQKLAHISGFCFNEFCSWAGKQLVKD